MILHQPSSDNAKGPNVTVFSWIHWNETSWIIANKILSKKIIEWEIQVTKWKLTLVLEANPYAIQQWSREVNHNMNRLFRDNNVWKSNEEKRARQLMKIVRESDYLLDLHSTSWPSIPFAYAEKNALELAQDTWIWHIIFWWNALTNQNWGDVLWGDTENYMNTNWWIWITFESWNHDDPDWVRESYRVLLNFLVQTGMIEKNHFQESQEEKKNIEIISFYKALSNNFKYSIQANNFNEIRKWTEIAIDNWKPIYAENDMILVMPKAEDVIKKWIEAFFIGKQI